MNKPPLEKIEQDVGMAAAAWDTVPPEQIIAAVMNNMRTNMPPPYGYVWFNDHMEHRFTRRKPSGNTFGMNIKPIWDEESLWNNQPTEIADTFYTNAFNQMAAAMGLSVPTDSLRDVFRSVMLPKLKMFCAERKALDAEWEALRGLRKAYTAHLGEKTEGIKIDVFHTPKSGFDTSNKCTIRATDLATGLYAESSEERGQHRNRAVAIEKLEKLLQNGNG